MANYRKVKPKQYSTRCGMCKYYKKMGNGKDKRPYRDRVILYGKLQEEKA